MMEDNRDPKKDVDCEELTEDLTEEEMQEAIEVQKQLLSKAALEFEILAAERDSWKKKAEDIFHQYSRLKDDMEGYRKRSERDLEAKIIRSKSEFIRGFLGVLDNFGRFLEAAQAPLGEVSQESFASFVKGVTMIEQEIRELLRRDGLEKIQSPVGAMFDPLFHEAVSAQEGGGDHGLVVEELQSGFTYKGEVLRATKVKVVR